MYSLLFFAHSLIDFCDLFRRGLSLSRPFLWNTGERKIKYLGRGVREVCVYERKTAREGFYVRSLVPPSRPQWFPARVYAKLFRGNGFRNASLVSIHSLPDKQFLTVRAELQEQRQIWNTVLLLRAYIYVYIYYIIQIKQFYTIYIWHERRIYIITLICIWVHIPIYMYMYLWRTTFFPSRRRRYIRQYYILYTNIW